MPKIQKGYKHNFDEMMRAAEHGRLALIDCQDKRTGKPARVICAVSDSSDGQYDIIPLARMFDGNPYDELNPPNPDGGYFAE